MKIRSLLLSAVCLLLVVSATACSFVGGITGKQPAGTTTAGTTTTTLPARTTTALPKVGYIHNSAASVRSGPGLAYKAIGGALVGEEITILGKAGDWYQIQFGEEIGYVSGHYVRFTPWDGSTPTAVTASQTTTATADTDTSDTTVADTTATTDDGIATLEEP